MTDNQHITPPNPAEQRLTFRLLSYWNRMRGKRSFPALADINIADIEEIWHFTFTIHTVSPVRDDHTLLYFGPQLVSIFGMDYTGELVVEALNDVIVNNTIGSYINTLEKREPTMEAASFHYDGKEIRYRSLFVPLSSDGVVIDYIMGTTNYKIF